MKLKSSVVKYSSIVLLAGFGLLSVYSAAAPKYSDWSPPINLGPVVNSTAEDFAPPYIEERA